MRPSARTEQHIWAVSTDEKKVCPKPITKAHQCWDTEEVSWHWYSTRSHRSSQPQQESTGYLTQRRHSDVFKGHPRKPLALWVFSVFHSNTLSRGRRGQGLGPCAGLSPALLSALLHTQGQVTLFPQKSSTMPGNSPQLLKLSTFFMNPLVEASVLNFWLVQIQSAGYKHTMRLSGLTSRCPLQHLVPLRARIRNRSELCKCPPLALLLYPIYSTVQCRETQPFPSCTRRQLLPSSATQWEKDTSAVLSPHIHAGDNMS